MGLTETWLSPELADAATVATPSSDGYKLYHRPRRNGKGGGVGLVCRDFYTIKLQPEHNFSSFEVIEATVNSYLHYFENYSFISSSSQS